MKRTIIFLFLTLAALLWGETVINGSRSILGTWDASGAAATLPVKVGTTLPANCTQGELFWESDATPGANLWHCHATDTWTQTNTRQQLSFAIPDIQAATYPRIWTTGKAGTLTRVKCWTDTGTADLTLVRSDSTNMHSAVTCSTSGAETTTFTAASVAADAGVGATIASISSATYVSVLIEYTREY